MHCRMFHAVFFILYLFLGSCASDSEGLSFDMNGKHYEVEKFVNYYYVSGGEPRLVIAYASSFHFLLELRKFKGIWGFDYHDPSTNMPPAMISFDVTENVPVGGYYHVDDDVPGEKNRFYIEEFSATKLDMYFNVRLEHTDGIHHVQITNGHIKAYL